MSFVEAYLVGLGVILIFMTAIWLVSVLIKNSSIVDIFWGAGFVVAAIAYFALTPDGYIIRKGLLTGLVAIWGLRLSVHIGVRNMGHGEDFRYQKWRDQHGTSYWWVSFFRVYVLQGVIMWLVSAPLLAAMIHSNPSSITVFDMIGVVVWAIGFYFEAVGDWQLMRFKSNPENKGKLLTTGVWAWSRHPNYFGDACQWWGFWLIAVSIPGGWLTILSPLLMTYLLVRVSGVALLERSLRKSKPGYETYVANTPAFVPRPPRQSTG